ncbi:hypothetical protein AUJ66_03720 [Candidatus Desantisbacteria bacterium CG1_02_38_46]|nr:MAG: hypothetical protein AUJ66_03720 [Candidatus Desantisbacteria bacterium CG1_02_38_46]
MVKKKNEEIKEKSEFKPAENARAEELEKYSKELEEDRKVLDNIIELNPYSVQICDAEGHHIRANKAFQKLFGATPPPEWSFFNDPLLKKKFPELLEKLKKGESIKIPAIWYNPHDVSPEAPDNPICLGATHFPVFDDKGNLEIIVNIHEDITELKRLQEKEKELAAAAETKAIIDGMPDSLIVLNLNGVIVNVNPAFTKTFGWKPEERIGKSFDELEDIEKFMKPLGELIETGNVEPVETVLRTKDGKKLAMSIAYSLIKDADGNSRNIIATLRDITKLKRAEDEVVAARDYTDNIIKSMIDTLIVVDPDAKIRTINPATVELLGYKENELIGKPVATIFTEEISIFKGTRLKKLIEEGSIRNYDITCRTKTGENIPVSFSGSVMKDKEGKLVGIVGIARDMRLTTHLIDELKKSEAQLKEWAKTLEQRVNGRTKELEEKVEELGKFSRLAVGRELKMVELKEKIKKLEQELENRI